MKIQRLLCSLIAVVATACLGSFAPAQYHTNVQGHAEFQSYSYSPQGYSDHQIGVQYQSPQNQIYNNQAYAPHQTYSSQPQQQAYQQQPAQFQSNQPTYVAPIHQGSGTQYHDGVRYDTNAGIGFDQRTSSQFGGNYYGSDDKFLGARGTVGAGLYGEAGVSQSGQVGDVRINNYANGNGFLGTEAGAQAGLSQDGLGVGANAFAGGRVSGTVGTEVGAFGVGGTGEAWSGAGLEAGMNAGYTDGKVRLGGEFGAALGVGGKLGFQAEVDVRQIGQDVKGTAQDVGQWSQKAGRDVNQWGRKAGNNIDRTVNNVGRDIGRTSKKIGRDVGNAGKKAWGFIKGKK